MQPSWLRLLFAAPLAVGLLACGGTPSGPGPIAVEETVHVIDVAASVEAPIAAAEATGTPSPVAATPVPVDPTQDSFALTLAAAATQQAPTLWAGETLLAQTLAAALPTPTPTPNP